MRERFLVPLLLAAVTTGCILRKPAIAPPPDLRVAATPERIARGRYIFEILADCSGCHSERDYHRLGAPVMESGRGKGAPMYPEPGIPGSIIASNITPDPDTGLGRWTDGEKIRAIREGISRDGRVLFPMMPYRNYRRMSDDDVQSLVTYINTLPPVRNALPRSRVNFIVAAYVKNWPRPARSVPDPDRSDPIRYGEYLATLASCVDCHSPLSRGRPVARKLFAGGRMFGTASTPIRSPNLTPDLETGIGKWSEQDFLTRFSLYKRYAEKGSPKVKPESFSPMPWLTLSQAAPEDLRAIYVYLRSQPPVRNLIKR